MLNNIVALFNAVVNHQFNVVAVSADKKPVTTWKKYQRNVQTNQERQEQLALLKKGKAASIGLICGVNGLVNIDIDAVDKDSPFSPPIPDEVPRQILAELRITWPYPWAWRSASGKGWHIWLVVEDLPYNETRLEIENHEHSTVKAIEVRAWGHYSMIPQFVTVPDEKPASVPWSRLKRAVGLVTKKASRIQQKNNDDARTEEALKEFELWCLRLATVGEGGRNETLNKAAFALGRFVGLGVLNEEDVKTKLFETITKQRKNPLPPREAYATIESGLRSGKEKAVLHANTNKQNNDSSRIANTLINLALENAEFFVSLADQTPYVTFVDSGKKCVVPLESKLFEDWLSGLYFKTHNEKLLSSENINAALRYFNYVARYQGEPKDVYIRVAPDGEGGVYIDTGDAPGRAIHVTPKGWDIVDDPPVAFIRPKTQRELPKPRRGGSLETLRSFLNVNDNESWALIKAWLTTALIPEIPYPVLVLLGEQGSAKSTMAELLRSLIDPAYPILRRPPRDQDSLHIAAQSCWVVAFDNVSAIPPWLSDDLCSLVTGSGMAKRKLYTDTEEVVTYAMRPFILNGITDFVQRGDLLDRSLIIDVPHIPTHKRLSKAQLLATFEQQRPYIFGALLDRLAGALREHNSINLRELPRMADFTMYAAAAEKADVGATWSKKTSLFIKSYQAVQENAKEQMFEAHVVGPSLYAWLCETVLPWEGTAADLLRAIESKANERNDRSVRTPGWPTTPHALRCALRRLLPALRSEGFVVSFIRTYKHRYIRIDKEQNDEPPHPDTDQPDDGGDEPGGDKRPPQQNDIERPQGSQQRITWLETSQDVDEALHDIMTQQTVGFDIETTGLKPREDRIRLIQVATPRTVYMLDAFKTDVRLMERLFTSGEGPVLAGHNLKFDLAFLRRAGIDSPNGERLFDTMLASKLLNAGVDNVSHSLAAVVKRYLGKTLNKTLQKSNWDGHLSQEQLDYAATDAAILLPLSDVLSEKLVEHELVTASEVEMRALPAIVWMEDTGVQLDTTTWEAQSNTQSDKIKDLEQQLNNMAGTTINWSSTKQVLTLLRARGHEVTQTDKETLKPLADSDPLVAVLLQYKDAFKRQSAFGSHYLTWVADDGRIHPSIDQAGAHTGRMTCRDPNLQQIPREKTYRRCFTAPEHRVLIKADYSQIELRIAAELTQDQRMLEAYRTNQDLHKLTAHLVLGVPLEDVTKQQRQAAKALNFGLLYGMGAQRFKQYAASQYGVMLTDDEAVEFRNKFFTAYQGVKRWHQRQNKGPEAVRTLSGRRRLNVEKYTEKLNTPVQGTGADGIKIALALLWETRALYPSAAPVLAVHDEIVVECDVNDAENVKAWLEDCMKQGMAKFLRAVPVDVEATVCTDWSGTPVQK